MNSLDSAKKISVKRTKTSSSSLGDSAKLARKKIQKKYPSLSKKEQTKRSILWILVGGMFVLIIVGWVFFLRLQIVSNLNKGGGFSEISEIAKKIFKSIDEGMEKFSDTIPSKLESITSESTPEAQIEELEKKVFPQFENQNTNINK